MPQDAPRNSTDPGTDDHATRFPVIGKHCHRVVAGSTYEDVVLADVEILGMVCTCARAAYKDDVIGARNAAIVLCCLSNGE
jgi:hypothetical protein